MEGNDISIYRENILFVYLDLDTPIKRDLFGSLRVIHDNVQMYSDLTKFLNLLEESNERIFLISTSDEKDLIEHAQECSAVVAIFVWNFDVEIDRKRFPKLLGSYKSPEELLVSVRNAYEWFEQTQLELMVFERDQLFLWLQLWREFIQPTHPEVPSNKEKFVDMAEKHYRGNMKLLKLLDDFDYCYEPNDALQWCFYSPFPAHFLRRALSSRNTEQIDLCRFLINDVSDVLHQSINDETNRQFYRGIKVTNEGLEKLMKHTGKLICPKGFFTCNKSRKVALEHACSTTYRPDLHPVLLKINCPPGVPFGEVPTVGTAGLIVFDVYTAFRVKYVNRGPVSVVKLEPADEDGRNLAYEYRMQHKSENLHDLLHQLTALPDVSFSARLSPVNVTLRVESPTVLSTKELRAQNLVENGQIDEGLACYQRLKHQSPRILNIIGHLYANRKGDYNTAVKYYKKALKIQEQSGEDVSGTLTQLGIVHHNRREFDLALECHSRALLLQKVDPNIDPSLIASSLIGIANAQWGQRNLSEALENAQQALVLYESVESGNEANLAMNLAVLANIHYRAGDYNRALEYAQRAVRTLESYAPYESPTLAASLNNLAAIQMKLRLLTDAERNFDKALKICEKSLPEGHPKRVVIEKNIQRNKAIIKKHTKNGR